jgi:hypothetical protein
VVPVISGLQPDKNPETKAEDKVTPVIRVVYFNAVLRSIYKLLDLTM